MYRRTNGLFHHKTQSLSGLTPMHRSDIRVLVPGAGLGRLAYNIAKLGIPQSSDACLLVPF